MLVRNNSPIFFLETTQTLILRPHTRAYPPTEIDCQDLDDLSDNYAGKAVTKILDLNGKGDYSTIQEAIDSPMGGLVIRGVGGDHPSQGR